MQEQQSFDQLLANATDEVDGPDANRMLWETRARLQAEHGRAVCYELVLTGKDWTWNEFVRTEMIKLTDHLEAKQIAPPSSAEVLVLVWRDSTMHVFDGPGFWSAVADVEECSVDALINRVVLLRAERDAKLVEDLPVPVRPSLPAPKDES